MEEDDNRDHQNNPLNEDVYQYTILSSHTGWKLFTLPYSDFVVSPSPSNGNHKQETSLITALVLTLTHRLLDKSCQVIFDLPTLSIGKPFNPNQF